MLEYEQNKPALFDKRPPINITDVAHKRVAFLNSQDIEAANLLLENCYNAWVYVGHIVKEED